MVDRRKAFSFIPARTIVTDPHHRESPTRREQGLNLRGIQFQPSLNELVHFLWFGHQWSVERD